jgi:hypothetical protein
MDYNEPVEVFYEDRKLGNAHFRGRATKRGFTWSWSGILIDLDFDSDNLTEDQYTIKFSDGAAGEIFPLNPGSLDTPTIGGRPRVAPPRIEVRGTGPGLPPRVKK